MTASRRKRSKRAALVMMVPAGTLLVAACAPHVEDVVVYSDVQECQQDNPGSAQQCESDFQQAAALHPEVAPKYATREECEADFGTENCEPARQQYAGGGFFMPLMMGYMAGRMSSPLAGQAAPGVNDSIPPLQDRDSNAGRGSVATQPLYKSRDDQRVFRTGSNYPVATSTGVVQVQPNALRPRAGGFVRSGGFGATAARMATGSGG